MPDAAGSYPITVSPAKAGMMGRCPRCGEGKIFTGFLNLRPACPKCGLDLAFADSGDGPAVFIILFVGFLVVGLALFIEFTWHWPYWLHALVWVPTVLGLSIGLLRPLKGWFVGMQYRHKAAEGRTTDV